MTQAMRSNGGFLNYPSRPGAMGALMDEYAYVAGELCYVVEQLAPERFGREVESEDEDCRSLLALCRHVIVAALSYANYIREARGLECSVDRDAEVEGVNGPADLRPRLMIALRYTEGALEGLYDADYETVAAISFTTRWRATYDPDSLLEHAIVHLLRHRRQILRWPV